jgi:hypothetical protein
MPTGKLFGIDAVESLAPVKIPLNGVNLLNRLLALIHIEIF